MARVRVKRESEDAGSPPPTTRKSASSAAKAELKTAKKPRAKKEPGVTSRRSKKAVVKREEEGEEEEREGERGGEIAGFAEPAPVKKHEEIEIKLETHPDARLALADDAGDRDGDGNDDENAHAIHAKAAAASASSFPLPGVFASAVDTPHAVRVVVAAALASSALSAAARLLVSWAAATPAVAWTAWTAYEANTAAPGRWPAAVALGVRLLKLAFSWGALSHLVALDALSHGPIVYLLSSFYNVPLSAAAASAAIDLLADVVPLAAWRWLTAADVEDEDVDESEDGTVFAASAASDDPLTFAVSGVFAAALYGFTFVQACRFFLPGTLVVHFFGIATVEPARTVTRLSLVGTASDAAAAAAAAAVTPPSLYDTFIAVFLSVPALLLNLVNGIAARTFIFAGPSSSPASPSYAKVIASRTLALSLVVGADLFQQLFLGIQGVDAEGAAAFAGVWAVAPLLVGPGLGLAGV